MDEFCDMAGMESIHKKILSIDENSNFLWLSGTINLSE
jgi:hypothetical protein